MNGIVKLNLSGKTDKQNQKRLGLNPQRQQFGFELFFDGHSNSEVESVYQLPIGEPD